MQSERQWFCLSFTTFTVYVGLPLSQEILLALGDQKGEWTLQEEVLTIYGLSLGTKGLAQNKNQTLVWHSDDIFTVLSKVSWVSTYSIFRNMLDKCSQFSISIHPVSKDPINCRVLLSEKGWNSTLRTDSLYSLNSIYIRHYIQADLTYMNTMSVLCKNYAILWNSGIVDFCIGFWNKSPIHKATLYI